MASNQETIFTMEATPVKYGTGASGEAGWELKRLGLKRVMLVDVVTVALGFALRAAAGAVAIDVRISPWLVLCVFFLCLYLGFIKRLCDLTSAEARGKGQWRSDAGYDDRAELNWLLGVSADEMRVLATMGKLVLALGIAVPGHELPDEGIQNVPWPVEGEKGG